MCFAELSIGNRVDSAIRTDDEQQPCTDSSVDQAAENKADEAVNHSGNINLGSSQREANHSQYEPDNQPITSSSPLSTGSASIRHSASDSLVFSAEVEVAASPKSPCQGLAYCPLSEQVDGSAGLNGCCKTEKETGMSQVRLVLIDNSFSIFQPLECLGKSVGPGKCSKLKLELVLESKDPGSLMNFLYVNAKYV